MLTSVPPRVLLLWCCGGFGSGRVRVAPKVQPIRGCQTPQDKSRASAPPAPCTGLQNYQPTLSELNGNPYSQRCRCGRRFPNVQPTARTSWSSFVMHVAGSMCRDKPRSNLRIACCCEHPTSRKSCHPRRGRHGQASIRT